MLIINGVEVLDGVYLVNPSVKHKVSTYTDNHAVTFSQTGHTLVMSAGANNKGFTLPSPAASNVGAEFTFANIGTGRLTITITGTGVYLDTATVSTGTMYSDTDSIASLKIRLVSATRWTVIGARGDWSVT